MGACVHRIADDCIDNSSGSDGNEKTMEVSAVEEREKGIDPKLR